jgi:putative transposase
MKPPIRQRKPTRMPRYNYSSSGCYFVTIVTKNKENYLGKIVANKVVLTNMGEIAKSCWLQIPEHFPNIRLDEFVIMPNHVHGIIVILHKAEDDRFTFPDSSEIADRSKMKLSKIIQAFKSSVTRMINQDPTSDYFAWQKSFYDHIVHNYKELIQIRRYISENPLHYPIEQFLEIKNKDCENLFL